MKASVLGLRKPYIKKQSKTPPPKKKPTAKPQHTNKAEAAYFV